MDTRELRRERADLVAKGRAILERAEREHRTLTDAEDVEIRRMTGLVGDVRPSLFVLATRRMEADLETMPTVVRADVTATLPDRVAISVVERTPVIAWWTGDEGFLVDVEGIVLGPTSAFDEAELGDGSTGSSLPALVDERTGTELVPGEHVDAVDLEAVRP